MQPDYLERFRIRKSEHEYNDLKPTRYIKPAAKWNDHCLIHEAALPLFV